jgi:hypothetical protein
LTRVIDATPTSAIKISNKVAICLTDFAVPIGVNISICGAGLQYAVRWNVRTFARWNVWEAGEEQ